METLSTLIGSLRERCASLPDKRTGANRRYTMADIGLAAFSVFFMQSPSFLSHQRHLAQGQGRSNFESLFGMTAVPCDNHIRAMLDPVEPRHFDPLFNEALETLERSGGLTAFRRLKGQVLIALDGTEYFRSAKLHCSQCSSRARAGLSDILCLRPFPSLADEPLAEDDGELGSGLEPFTRWSFPVFRSMVQHQI